MLARMNPHTQLVQPLCKSIYKFLKKLKLDLPHDSAVSLLGTHVKECKSTNKRDTCTLMFIVILFTQLSFGISLSAHQPINKWTKYDIYIHNKILFSHREE
jgi:hypothetical protein